MKNKKLMLLAILIIVIIVAILLIRKPSERIDVDLTNENSLETVGTSIGDTVPNLILEDINGKEISFNDFRGKGMIVNSWAGWCPFCINEMPDLQQVSDENEDLVVLFVHRTRTESKNTGERFLVTFEEKGTPIIDPVVYDDKDSFYTTFFGVGMPVTLFIDKNGVIQDKNFEG
tara:strand:- start:39832 stop:40353 length:522 start_codon:yes stop_codon:yes gene_type:complete